eukprot:CAMPEP_0184650210 /NCGR_PEP_ID=MMETSP0308-20130426/7740_1 /TAXON_ID=38269 /ORGANISM="Gloeochaete witrockiana, Strain SAG 46.84" /LENGTH=65 /DNA_ID=CAMNT_0027083583 /DNA_START=54 /DNA_END=251 /DNA_ORIENTATION=-
MGKGGLGVDVSLRLIQPVDTENKPSPAWGVEVVKSFAIDDATSLVGKFDWDGKKSVVKVELKRKF